MKTDLELLKEFERPRIDIESFLKESETEHPYIQDAATTPEICRQKKFKFNHLLEFRKQCSKVEIVPLNCKENCPGKYDTYLETTLSHIAKMRNIHFEYALEDPKIHEGVPHLPLSGASEQRKKLLLLDLDETLIHADFSEEFKNNKSIKYDIIIKFFAQNEEDEDNENFEENYENNYDYDYNMKKRQKELTNQNENQAEEKEEFNVGIFIRNGVNEFLTEVSKYFDVGIFTASVKEYADAVIDVLDPEKKLIKFRLYRTNCISVNDSFTVKDLRIIKGIDLKNTILIDNSMYSFSAQLTNGVLINSFYTDKNDTELYNVLGYLLNFVLPANDIRKVNEQFFNFQRITDDLIKEINQIEQQN